MMRCGLGAALFMFRPNAVGMFESTRVSNSASHFIKAGYDQVSNMWGQQTSLQGRALYNQSLITSNHSSRPSSAQLITVLCFQCTSCHKVKKKKIAMTAQSPPIQTPKNI